VKQSETCTAWSSR